MSAFDASSMNLADFAMGHADDPLAVAQDFVDWRAAAPDLHALFGREMTERAAPRTALCVGGQTYNVINMASLDYLGLCGHADMIAAQVSALNTWGNGAAGTPLVSGTMTPHRQLETALATLTGKSEALVYSSGFSAATGFCVGVLRRGDVAVLDQLAHMSWYDGVCMANAKTARFAHNDPEDLDKVLAKHDGARRIVVVDGLYSMDGDFARLGALLDVCDAHGVGLVVDEAHSVFADGPTGAGMAERLGELGRVRALMGTFSKSLGMVGGFVACGADLAQYLRYYSHPYVFSASLPPATVAGILAGVRIAQDAQMTRDTLCQRATQFRDGLVAMGLDTGASESWIVPVILGEDRAMMLNATDALMRNGLYVAPIDFPAVPENKVRLRCAVSAGHSAADIDEALSLLERYVAKPLKAGGRI